MKDLLSGETLSAKNKDKLIHSYANITSFISKCHSIVDIIKDVPYLFHDEESLK